MSAATIDRRRDARPEVRLGAVGILAAERIKLASVASTWWIAGTAIVLSLGLALLIALTGSAFGGDPGALPVDREAESALGLVGTTSAIAMLVVAVLGVLSIGGEHASGTIRTSWSAVPARLPMLAAKAAVTGAFAFAVGLVVHIGGFAISSVATGSHGLVAPLLADGILLRLAAGSLALALVAVLALAIGSIVRATAGGIAIVVGILFVAPLVLAFVPADWALEVAAVLPSQLASDVYALGDGGRGTIEALLLLAAWVVAAWIPAAIIALRRDA